MTAIEKLYKGLVLLVLALQLLWVFMPWGFAYDDVSIRSLEWLGYGAWVSSQSIIIISNLFLVLYILISFGLFFYNIWARRIFTILALLGGLMLPVYGMYVSSGYEDVLIYFINLGDGFLLAMCYLTSIASKFTQQKSDE